jgi:hypothetical protein
VAVQILMNSDEFAGSLNRSNMSVKETAPQLETKWSEVLDSLNNVSLPAAAKAHMATISHLMSQLKVEANAPSGELPCFHGLLARAAATPLDGERSTLMVCCTGLGPCIKDKHDAWLREQTVSRGIPNALAYPLELAYPRSNIKSGPT